MFVTPDLCHRSDADVREQRFSFNGLLCECVTVVVCWAEPETASYLFSTSCEAPLILNETQSPSLDGVCSFSLCALIDE